ncbi:hypothetical protein DNH61_04765 [Paenibacillus sambharensis]|uniref:Thioredoxin domain-containing protein n=1 Tax=Paenibacillus sambharensis TaxID=1803190 RepID=A0A2W1L9Y6_9BACL|nr:thioredoxin family protein [Paenibacillus sambharensis]PZD97038.1 hypothetical protein DNH61_04765 [Paenibacillus sambharensis]
MKRLYYMFIIAAAVVLLSSCSGDAREDSLSTIKNGIVLYHDGSEASVKLLDTLNQLSESDQFNLISVDVTKERGKLDEYEQKNRKMIDQYSEVKELESRLANLKSSVMENEAAGMLNSVMLDYRKALNLVKEPRLSSEQEAEYENLVARLADRQELNKAELKRLLELQKSPRLQIPVYSAYDQDAEPDRLPVMKVVYEGNIRKSFSFGTAPIEDEILNNPEELKWYLKEHAWISNFHESSDGKTIESKLNNKETFIMLVWGNSCPHCHKVMPVLDKLSADTGVKVERIDTFIESNNRKYYELFRSGKYELTEPKWVPTLVYIKNGKQVSAIGAFDWAIDNVNADLGYDIDEQVIKAYLEQIGS